MNDRRVKGSVPHTSRDPDGGSQADPITFPAREDRIPRVLDTILERARGAGYGPRELEMRVGLREALRNAVEHGAGGDPGRTVKVRTEVLEDRFRVTVRDGGAGVPSEALATEEAPPLGRRRGRGLWMIRRVLGEAPAREPEGGLRLDFRADRFAG